MDTSTLDARKIADAKSQKSFLEPVNCMFIPPRV